MKNEVNNIKIRHAHLHQAQMLNGHCGEVESFPPIVFE